MQPVWTAELKSLTVMEIVAQLFKEEKERLDSAFKKGEKKNS